MPAESRVDSFARRTLDIIGAGLGLTVLSPVLAVIAVVVRMQDGDPAFHRSTRVGRNGQPFTLYKFRTMVVEADKSGSPLTIKDDARVTSVGRKLRRYKLDELPQLYNVLRGDMSLVGPRPENPYFVQNYDDRQRQLLLLRPGITSPASLRYRNDQSLLSSGMSEQVYRDKMLPKKLSIELEYLQRRTFWTDLLVIIQTIGVIPLVDDDTPPAKT